MPGAYSSSVTRTLNQPKLADEFSAPHDGSGVAVRGEVDARYLRPANACRTLSGHLLMVLQ